uniref:Uncharacterized protein n=1 Tax=Myoviridae sp. ctZzC3 TaxID=2825130 RepID=A0A8S5PZS9_9CAUD|nr:MAG TPA: hypothetical protein [Myoviridae sp. ctZzC3]
MLSPPRLRAYRVAFNAVASGAPVGASTGAAWQTL